MLIARATAIPPVMVAKPPPWTTKANGDRADVFGGGGGGGVGGGSTGGDEDGCGDGGGGDSTGGGEDGGGDGGGGGSTGGDEDGGGDGDGDGGGGGGEASALDGAGGEVAAFDGAVGDGVDVSQGGHGPQTLPELALTVEAKASVAVVAPHDKPQCSRAIWRSQYR